MSASSPPSCDVLVRKALPSDAPDMVALMNRIISKGGTTAYKEPFTVEKMMDCYVSVAPPFGISCMVAVLQDESGIAKIVGFQGLEWADPNWCDPHDPSGKLDASWAFIATFVADGYQRKGIGRKLFDATVEAAKSKGVTKIDATIQSYNLGGQAYYERMGFHEYRRTETSTSKKFVMR